MRWWRDYNAECEAWLATLDDRARAIIADVDAIDCRFREWPSAMTRLRR